MTKVTDKSTKRELLTAYRDMEKKYNSVKDNRTTANIRKDTEMVQIASKTKAEDVVKNLADLRLNTNQVISNIEESILDKKSELDNLNTAIGVQTVELKTVHQIIHTADSLAILLRANDEEKERHLTDLKELKELKDREYIESVEKSETKKTELIQEYKRKHEELLYDYTLKSKRQVIELADKKAASQREIEKNKNDADDRLTNREAILIEKEEVVVKLAKSVEEYPTRVAVAEEKAAKDATDRQAKSHSFQVKALESKMETTKVMLESENKMLHERIDGLTEESGHLRKQLEDANAKVVKVAETAISGAQAKIVPTQFQAQQVNSK